MPPRVLLIVTRVIGLGEDRALLGAWDCGDDTGPWYFGADGTKIGSVPQSGNAVVIVRGDPQADAGDRIERAIQGTSADQLCLLVHPGGGGSAESFIQGAWPRDHRLWSIRCAHAFSTQGDGSSIRVVLLELGSYAQRRNPRFFEYLLTVILKNCCSDDTGFLAVMQRVIEDPQYRTSLSLPAKPPAIGVRDPIATIIHDVVSCFDALVLDLEVALENPGYWDEDVRARNSRNLETALDRLRFLVGEEGSEEAKAWAERRGFPIKPVERCVLLSERAATSERAGEALEKLKALVREWEVAASREIAQGAMPLHGQAVSHVKQWLGSVVRQLEAFRERGRDEIQPTASAADAP